MFNALDISASGLVAQRVRQELIAKNVANAQSTKAGADSAGRPIPYRRQFAVFMSQADGQGRPAGVRVAEVAEDPGEGRKVFDPRHPHAGPDGYVRYPNVDLNTELPDMMEATRAYEANITAMDATKAMMSADLRLLA